MFITSSYQVLVIFMFSINIITVCSYTVSFPTYKRNLAIISNTDIKYLTDYDKNQIVKLFNSVPILLFKNQKINLKKDKFISQDMASLRSITSS